MIGHDSLRVAVLMGGLGGEREVSLKSGRAVCSGLKKAGHEVVPYEVNDPALPGLWGLTPDAVFVALHGTFGEDGAVQSMMVDAGVPYTGSGPEASRLAMDKIASKRMFVRHAVPTAGYFPVDPTQSLEDVTVLAEQFGYPLVVKPSASGSSLGVNIVKRWDQLAPALAAARAESPDVLVEHMVRGREFTVGVLEGVALPMVELVVAEEFFDYSAKYEDDRTGYIMPVSLLPTLYRKACDAALRAYRVLGCSHMARVDLLYGYDGRLYVLEANTIPGFTPRSLLPRAAAGAGIPFPQLCDRLVQAAVRDAAAGRRLSA